MPLWLREKLWIRPRIEEALRGDCGRAAATGASRVLFTEHHESHAASAFFPSPFERPRS